MNAIFYLLVVLFASMATASPIAHPDAEQIAADTFKIINNNCLWTKKFAMYQVAGAMIQRSEPTNVVSKGSHTINAPFKDRGMRISGHAEWGTAGQWKAQALFEFGFGAAMGQEDTAFNLSLMPGSDPDIGIAVYPSNKGCGTGSKVCKPDNCPLDQGWTDPGQAALGSPADGGCYGKKTDFTVVFCP